MPWGTFNPKLPSNHCERCSINLRLYDFFILFCVHLPLTLAPSLLYVCCFMSCLIAEFSFHPWRVCKRIRGKCKSGDNNVPVCSLGSNEEGKLNKILSKYDNTCFMKLRSFLRAIISYSELMNHTLNTNVTFFFNPAPMPPTHEKQIAVNIMYQQPTHNLYNSNDRWIAADLQDVCKMFLNV